MTHLHSASAVKPLPFLPSILHPHSPTAYPYPLYLPPLLSPLPTLIISALLYLTGSVMNYLVIALPVFTGVLGPKGGGEDKGAAAQLISNSSFAILQLIYRYVLNTEPFVLCRLS